MADDVKSYAEKLKTWGLYAGAVLALSVASALAQRWLGRDVQLPPPPVILVQPNADGSVPVVKMLQPQPLEK